MKLLSMLSTSVKQPATAVWYRMMLVIIFQQKFLFYLDQGNKLIYTNKPTYLTGINSFLSIRKEKQDDQIE